jgi:hypothetical protein
VGALANGIAFSDTTSQVLVSYPGGPVVMYDPATGMAINTAGISFGTAVGVATKNGLGRSTVQVNLSCFVVSRTFLIRRSGQWCRELNRGRWPW